MSTALPTSGPSRPNSRNRTSPQPRQSRSWLGARSTGRSAAPCWASRARSSRHPSPRRACRSASPLRARTPVRGSGRGRRSGRAERPDRSASISSIRQRRASIRAADRQELSPRIAMSTTRRPLGVTSVALRTMRSDRSVTVLHSLCHDGRYGPCRADPVLGFYGPDSMMWRINREAVLLGAGPARLLLQVAHPLVAEEWPSTARSSRDPFRRLQGTMRHHDGPRLRRRPGRRTGGPQAEPRSRRRARRFRRRGGPAPGSQLPRPRPGAPAVGPGDADRDQRPGLPALGLAP